MDAAMTCAPWPIPLKAKVSELMQRIWSVSHSSVEAKEYIPATPADYGVAETQVAAGMPQSPHIVLFFPQESGYQLLHTAGFIGPSVKLNLKAAHEGAFNIVQLRTRDRSIAYRLTFVENSIVKKIEPIFYRDNGLSIEVESQDPRQPKPRPMIFPSWLRLLKQLGNVAKHLLYISIPKDMFDNFEAAWPNNVQIPRLLIAAPLANTSRQLYFISFACTYASCANLPKIPIGRNLTFTLTIINSTTYLPGPTADGENMTGVFSAAGRQPLAFSALPEVRSYVKPTLQEMLFYMDGVYNNAKQGDMIVFYFSGYGRQIFRPEQPAASRQYAGPGTQQHYSTAADSEPLVGLMPSDAIVSNKEIAEITDLTSIHVRYWCNALYLIKKVHSVVIILDTSFSDPGPDYHKVGDKGRGTSATAPASLGGGKQESVVRMRSHRPHLMADQCKVDLPETLQWPSWYEVGRALDDPADSLRVCDNLNDAPYYFAPSRQWASKHVVIQACRDTELAYERLFYQAVEEVPGNEISMKFEGHGSEQGKLTHFMHRTLRLYFPPSESEIAVALDTWPNFFARLNSAGKDELENQHPVCYIGEAMKHERIFSASRASYAPALFSIESNKDNHIISGTGFTGLPLSEELTLAAPTTDAESTEALKALAICAPMKSADPFLSAFVPTEMRTENEISYQIAATLPGKFLQAVPTSTRYMTLAVPTGTKESDSELMSIAQALNEKLGHKLLTKPGSEVLQHPPADERHSLWDWTLFDRHSWGRISKERTSDVRYFAFSLERKTWAEVKQLTFNFVNTLRTRIHESIKAAIDGKERRTFPNFRSTLQRFRSWLLERSEDIEYAETVNATNRVDLFRALNAISDAVVLSRDSNVRDEEDRNDPEFALTVCRNNVAPPTEDAHSLHHRLPVSQRLLAPVGVMTHAVLPLDSGAIGPVALKRQVGSFFALNAAFWKEQQQLSAKANPAALDDTTVAALFWCNFFALQTKQTFGTLMDPAFWLEFMEPHLTQGCNYGDLAQGHNLAGCSLIKTNPAKAIDHFRTAEALLAKIDRTGGVHLEINYMVAYASFKACQAGFAEAKREACKRLAQFTQSDAELTTEGALAALYTLARLSEQLDSKVRIAGGGNLWPLPKSEVAKLNLPPWSTVAFYVTEQYLSTHYRQSPTLQTDQTASAFLRVATKNNLGVLHESAGNYAEAIEQFKGAKALVKQLDIMASPDPISMQSKGTAESTPKTLQTELQLFVSLNLATVRALLTKESIIALNINANRSAISTGAMDSTFMLDWGHYLAACPFAKGDSPAPLIYNGIRSMAKSKPKASLALKQLIAAYQLRQSGDFRHDLYCQTNAKVVAMLLGAFARASSLEGGEEEVITIAPESHEELELQNEVIGLPSLMMGALIPIYEHYSTTPLSFDESLPIARTIHSDAKWLALEEDDFTSHLRQFALELSSPFYGDSDWLTWSMITLGFVACDARQFRTASQFFSKTFALVATATQKSLTKVEARDLQEIAGGYIRYANRQSQFFLAALPPQEIDAFHCKPDALTNCTTHLCPPMDWEDLVNVASLWYWRSWKVDQLVDIQLRRPPKGTTVGYRKGPPLPLSLGPREGDPKAPEFVTKGMNLGPISMSISIVTKVATAVPRSCALYLHDTERIELKVQLREAIKNALLEEYKKRLALEKKDNTHPKKRYRFHVLDCRSDGSIKILTRGTNMSGHAINIPFHTDDNSTTVRLGAITTQHEPLSIYFTGSRYEHHTPLTHVFVLMIREDNDSNPPLFDCRFFEQTSQIDADAMTRRALVRRTHEELQSQFAGRLIPQAVANAPPVVDGDTFHVEWFRIRSLPNVSPPTKLYQPALELRSVVYLNSGKLDSYRVMKPPPNIATGQTRTSPLLTPNYAARQFIYIPTRGNGVCSSPFAQSITTTAAAASAMPTFLQETSLTRHEASQFTISDSDKIYAMRSILPPTSLYSTTPTPTDFLKGGDSTQPIPVLGLEGSGFVKVANYLVTDLAVLRNMVREAFGIGQSLALNPIALEFLQTGEIRPTIQPQLPPPMAITTPSFHSVGDAVGPTPAPVSRTRLEWIKEFAYLLSACVISFTEKPEGKAIIADGTTGQGYNELRAAEVALPRAGEALRVFADLPQQGDFDTKKLMTICAALFDPLQKFMPKPASAQQPIAPLLIITTHGTPDFIRMPFAAMYSTNTGQCLVEGYMISLQPSLQSLHRSLKTYFGSIAPQVWDASSRIVIVPAATNSEEDPEMLKEFAKLKALWTPRAEVTYSTSILTSTTGTSRTTPIKILQLERVWAPSEQPKDSDQLSIPVGVDLALHACGDYVDDSPTTDLPGVASIASIGNGRHSAAGARALWGRLHGFLKIAKDDLMRGDFYTALANQSNDAIKKLGLTVDPTHLEVLRAFHDIFANAAMYSLALSELAQSIKQKIGVKALPYRGADNNLLTQLQRIRGTLHRFETSVINRPDLQRLDPVAAGHVEVLARDYMTAAKCYHVAPKPTPVSIALGAMCHLQSNEEAELDTVPEKYAEVVRSLHIPGHIIENPRATSAEIIAPSLSLLRSATCRLAAAPVLGSDADINAAKPREAFWLGLSAFASFVAWDLEDAKFKAQLALRLLTAMANGTDRLDSVVINPLIDALSLFLQMQASFAVDVKDLCRSRNKLAIIRQTQNKMLMTARSQNAVPTTLIPSDVWGSLALFGVPFSPLEFGLVMTPAQRNRLRMLREEDIPV